MMREDDEQADASWQGNEHLQATTVQPVTTSHKAQKQQLY